MIKELLKFLRVTIGEEPRRCLVGRAVAGNQIGRNRPWRTTETEKCRLCRKLGTKPSYGFVDRVELRSKLGRVAASTSSTPKGSS